MNPNDIFQIRNLLQGASSVLVVLGGSKDVDVVASGCGLYLTLGKAGKQTSIVSPQETKVALTFLYGIDKIENKISGSNNLVVSLPYQEGAIERVSYNIAGGKFNLVIEPRNEKINFDPKQIDYHYGSGQVDVIFVLGAFNLESLGALYSQHTNLFSEKPVINIDKNNNNTRFGRINLTNDISLSQNIARLIKVLNLPLDQDIASNLLTGISSVNGDLDFSTAKPEVLEAAAFLLRSGGKILKRETKREVISPRSPGQGKSQTVRFPQTQDEEAPDDWFKPKVFTTEKSATLL